jgi:hypothetical protein
MLLLYIAAKPDLLVFQKSPNFAVNLTVATPLYPYVLIPDLPGSVLLIN